MYDCFYKRYGGENVSKQKVVIMPKTQRILTEMGNNIKLARLRRDLPVTLIAERAGISRATLWSIEQGSSSVSLGAYAAVLHALDGMDKELLLIGKDDPIGRTIQDMKLPMRKRAPKQQVKQEAGADDW